MPQATITERSLHCPPYKRHPPEQTLLYHIIERHCPAFRDVMAARRGEAKVIASIEDQAVIDKISSLGP